jgi:hypothetical protein
MQFLLGGVYRGHNEVKKSKGNPDNDPIEVEDILSFSRLVSSSLESIYQ